MSDVQKNKNNSISKEDIIEHLPEKEAFEHLKTQESKQFQKEIKDIIKERRKMHKAQE